MGPVTAKELKRVAKVQKKIKQNRRKTVFLGELKGEGIRRLLINSFRFKMWSCGYDPEYVENVPWKKSIFGVEKDRWDHSGIRTRLYGKESIHCSKTPSILGAVLCNFSKGAYFSILKLICRFNKISSWRKNQPSKFKRLLEVFWKEGNFWTLFKVLLRYRSLLEGSCPERARQD